MKMTCTETGSLGRYTTSLGPYAVFMARNMRYAAAAILLLGLTHADAFYRGDEKNPRNYTLDAEYYVDWISVQPRIEHTDRFIRATNAYSGTAGSYTRRDLFNDQFVKIETPLTGAFRFTFDVEAGRDYDGLYEHYLLGGDYEFLPGWRAGVVGQPQARKEYADIGLSLRRRAASTKMDVFFMLPNFSFENKNDEEGYFETAPYNIQFKLYQDILPALTIFADVDKDFASKTHYDVSEFNFSFESFKPRGGLIWRLSEEQMLWLELASERTTKSRLTFPVPLDRQRDPRDLPAENGTRDITKDYDATRTYYEGRIEYVRWWRQRRLSAGAAYMNLRESSHFIHDRERTEEFHHVSRILYGLWGTPLSPCFFFTTGLYLDFVDHRQDYPANEEFDYRTTAPEGKIPFSIEWSGERFSITGGVAIQADQVAFGGGFMNGIVVF